jgi:cation-transporting P-type ATPase E
METGAVLGGLTEAEVRERIERGQVNDVTVSPSRTVPQILRTNVFTRFNAMIGSMLVIILIVGPYQDTLFGGVLMANTLIGIVQELRAKRTLDRLAVLTAPKARILREGRVQTRAVGEVVLDDVIELAPGDQVVVDGIVLEGGGLEVDESMVSGESDPVLKAPGDEVLSGSFAAAGIGRYRATRVGHEAYAASLAQEARRFAPVRSELRAGIDRILGIVTWAIIPTAGLLFFSQLRRNPGVADGLRGAVAGVVAMVPEGLVLLTSVAFAVGVVRLARQRVLVQELAAVEGLTRVDVVCVDKTGTLTEGRLTVEEVVVVGDRTAYDEALAALAAADRYPNATMLAIGERFGRVADGWDVNGSVPFSSQRKWSAAEFTGRGTWLLGAADVVASDGSIGGDIQRTIGERVQEGRRVVLLARTDAPLDGERLPAGLRAEALVVLGDRLREDAAKTIDYFDRQGLTLKVISGDDPRTVAAIARRLGVLEDDEAVDARELPEDPQQLATALEKHGIFGRVSPQQKRAMVRGLQAGGHVVAMTGDGVNDALALKDADLGIAMGSGSPATRSVAQLVLLDSTFEALPAVVDEGRRVLGNIERTSNLYVTKTVYAMLISIAVGVLGFAFPFLPRHLTLVGALTIGIPSFFLALAPNVERARPGFFYRVLRFSIPAGALAALATSLSYTLALDEETLTLREAQTAATMVLCWVGLLVLSIVVSPMTRRRLALIWGMALAFVSVLLVPFAREFFALQVPPLIVWLAGLGIAAIVWSFARLFVPHPRGDPGLPMM